MIYRVISTLFLTLFVYSLSAQTISTDRPNQSDASTTVPHQSFQIETGFFFSKVDFTNPLLTYEIYQTPVALLRYGLHEKVELRLLTSYLFDRRSGEDKYNQHFSNLELGAKVQLLNKKDVNTQLAFVSHLYLPTHEGNFGTINKIAGSNTLFNSIGLGYNLGYRYYGIESGDLIYSVVLGTTILSGKLTIFAEPYGEVVNLEDHFFNMDFGITYLLLDNLQLDAIYGLGLNNDMMFYSIGISWNYSRK